MRLIRVQVDADYRGLDTLMLGPGEVRIIRRRFLSRLGLRQKSLVGVLLKDPARLGQAVPIVRAAIDELLVRVRKLTAQASSPISL